jgi:serine/threonine protein kinase
VLNAGTRLGGYEIVAPLGAGGMGEVYRARDLELDRTVAIKVLPDAEAADAPRLARLNSEAKALASLNHPHIATLFGTGESDGRYFLVMELVDGETLAQRLERRGPLPLEETLRVALQIADALDAAHANGIIHRDLKPANIKVRSDHLVKVLDFGLAKRAAGASGAHGDPGGARTRAEFETAPGTVVGTVAYMAPELLRGAPADARCDIFALGIILFELLTGVHPFSGR